MTQEVFPEIQAATGALQMQIALTEDEIAEMKEAIATKKQLVHAWRKGVAAVAPQQPATKQAAARSPCAPSTRKVGRSAELGTRSMGGR